MDSVDTSVNYAAYIGLDWADKEHSVCLQVGSSSTVETYTVKQDPNALHDWLLKLQARFQGKKVAVAIEQSKGAVISALLNYDFIHIFRIPPKSLAKYREAFQLSGAKDDPTDAELLLDWIRLHRHRVKPWVPDKAEVRILMQLTEYRRELVGERVRLTNRLTQELKGYFPQALSWAGELDNPMACDFLENWSDLEVIQKTKPAQIRKFYQQHRCRRRDVLDRRLQEIRNARPLTSDRAVLKTSVTIVRTIVPLLRALNEGIAQVEAQIAELFAGQEDFELFDSLPGAGDILAPRLFAAFGSDRSRFSAAVEMQQFSGIAPITKRSGGFRTVHHRIKCPKFLKQTFHEYAASSVRHCRWAGIYYEMQRSRGKAHHAAVRALAYKWIRILYRCWKDRVPYNDSFYVQRLRSRSPQMARLLAPAA